MSYHAPGARHTVLSAPRAATHGQIVVADGFVGAAFKTAQVDRWTKPGSAAGQAQAIAAGEMYEILLGGILEAPASGNLAAAAVGSDVYINGANDTLGLAAQGLTGAVLNAGWLKVGKVTEIDATRSPAVLRINANQLALVRGTMP